MSVGPVHPSFSRVSVAIRVFVMERARHWVFTLNNPGPIPRDSVVDVALVDYIVVGSEVGESGTPHYQGYVAFKDRKRLTQVRAICPSAHWEVTRGTPKQASDYCKKDGDYYEHGELPAAQHVNGAAKRKAQYQEAYELAKQQRVTEIDPELQIKHLTTLDRIAAREAPVLACLENYPGFWIYGAPGVGKSRTAREMAPDAYMKTLNKWWDHYKNEEDVIIDDIDPDSAKYLVHHLKQWLDIYKFKCEYKGGAKDIRPKRIIITSNYSIDECFEREADQKAIKRRCDVTHML